MYIMNLILINLQPLIMMSISNLPNNNNKLFFILAFNNNNLVYDYVLLNYLPLTIITSLLISQFSEL